MPEKFIVPLLVKSPVTDKSFSIDVFPKRVTSTQELYGEGNVPVALNTMFPVLELKFVEGPFEPVKKEEVLITRFPLFLNKLADEFAITVPSIVTVLPASTIALAPAFNVIFKKVKSPSTTRLVLFFCISTLLNVPLPSKVIE